MSENNTALNLRWTRLFLPILILVGSSCNDGGGGPTSPPTPVATSISVSPTSRTLNALGATAQLSVEVRDQNGQVMSGASVSWQSSASAVAQVSSSGLVTAVSTGSATITATSGSATGQASISVRQDISAVSVQAGNGQTGYINEALPVNPTVKVEDSGGSPIPGTQVTFHITSGGGTVSATSATTGADGEASTTWTLGSIEGPQVLRATAGTVHADFTAAGEKRPANYAVLVYMAADNSLSVPGIFDIDEMEAVGSTEDVVVLVQAEFSPVEMALQNCTPACFNRPNYNTFRYEVQTGNGVHGPDGTVVDIGNRDMTSPAELADFITWATTNYPAENYILVLWNHGGGYSGLLEDATSAPDLMTLQELRTGLSMAGTNFAVIDFDMCLMGGIETAVSVDGFADYLVFSEETEPGEGNPYDAILQDLVGNPTQTPREVAQMFVGEFVGSYQGTRNSVTKSAFDMGQLGTVVNAWDALGNELAANISTYQGAIVPSSAGAQAYSYSYLKDLGHWLSQFQASLSSQPTSAANPSSLVAADLVSDLQTAIGRGVVANAYLSSTDVNANNVDNSTGLTVLLPSTSASDRLPSSGPGSLDAYKALYPGRGWTSFLEVWNGSLTELLILDQGNSPLELALVWESAAVDAGADLDLWVLEPNGNLFIPYLGVVTPNGVLSGESYPNTYYELYRTRQYVERGFYYFFGNLWTDPQDYRPLADVAYRFGSVADWTMLYDTNPLPFSTQVSWLFDPNFSFQRAVDGSYTDLQYIANWDIRASTVAEESSVIAKSALESSSAVWTPAGFDGVDPPVLTDAQMDFLHRLRTDPGLRALREANRGEANRAGSDGAERFPTVQRPSGGERIH